MEWEPPQPIRPTPSKQIPLFGSLKKVVMARACYWSPFATQIKLQKDLVKVTLEWRDEQFARAIIRRSGQFTAWEALHQQAQQQRTACGATPIVT